MNKAEERLLVAAYWDSSIRVYDEGDSEESQLLRVLSGEHREGNLYCFNYSSRMSILVSGSSNDLISVWEFDTGRL